MRVVLQAVGKAFDRDEVLCDVDLELGPGQIVAVIGLNGAGKTTLLRCLADVVKPTRGSIRWNESDSARDDLAVHRQLMFLPDAPLLFDDQTIVENLVMFLRAYAREAAVDDEQVVAVLRELDLLEHCTAQVGTLSRGQRYRPRWPRCS